MTTDDDIRRITDLMLARVDKNPSLPDLTKPTTIHSSTLPRCPVCR